jgi:organic radical activating enzyme
MLPIPQKLKAHYRKYKRWLERYRSGNLDSHKCQFEIHLAQACNLTCDSCSHYSNYHFSGVLALETAEAWYQKWQHRLRPRKVTLLGGEPAINPKLCEHILLARKYWPNARIRLVSNGLLLHKHPRLPEILKQIGDSELEVSKHHNSPEYEQLFQGVVDLVQGWKAQHGINLVISDSFSNWSRRYLDENGALEPFRDHDPKQSWNICPAKKCMQLHEGKLWKCPILAYLPMMKQKRQLSSEWDFYLSYQGLDATCSSGELDEFLSRREESFCSMCPSFKRPFRKSDPLQK